MLEELQKRWRGSSAEGHLLGDKVTAMEAKCEQLEEKLADARSEVTIISTHIICATHSSQLRLGISVALPLHVLLVSVQCT